MPAPARSSLQVPVALLLAAAGGVLDAEVYLAHGQVFANAQTGNVIFLAIAAMQRNWLQVLRHVSPILAFLVGVLAARWLYVRHQRHRPRLTLLFEIVVLAILPLLPHHFPELLFTAAVAFASAFQATTFRHIGRFTYNSTFVAGNLRELAEGAFEGFSAKDPAARFLGRRKALKLTAICVAFTVGAALGTLAAPFPHGLWAAEPLLLGALLLHR